MNLIPLEQQECESLADWLGHFKMIGEVEVYSHTAQSTFTKSWQVKARNTKMGVMPGVPDYIVVTKDAVYFIEMKRLKGGTTTESQKAWIKALRGKKVKARVCKGCEEALEFMGLEI